MSYANSGTVADILSLIYHGAHLFLQLSAKDVKAATTFFTLDSGKARTTAATNLYVARLDPASWYCPIVEDRNRKIPLTACSGNSVKEEGKDIVFRRKELNLNMC